MSDTSPSAWFSPLIYETCPICYGSREAFGSKCITCTDPDPAIARKILERLRPEQMRFLRAFGHTLASQPVTGAEWDKYGLCEFYVEDDDGEPDPDDYGWLIEPTRHWFAGSQASMRYGSLATYIRYSPMGLMLRECLMAGADALVRPPASADTHPKDGDRLRAPLVSGAVGASRDAQPPSEVI